MPKHLSIRSWIKHMDFLLVAPACFAVRTMWRKIKSAPCTNGPASESRCRSTMIAHGRKLWISKRRGRRGLCISQTQRYVIGLYERTVNLIRRKYRSEFFMWIMFDFCGLMNFMIFASAQFETGCLNRKHRSILDKKSNQASDMIIENQINKNDVSWIKGKHACVRVSVFILREILPSGNRVSELWVMPPSLIFRMTDEPTANPKPDERFKFRVFLNQSINDDVTNADHAEPADEIRMPKGENVCGRTRLVRTQKSVWIIIAFS